MSFEKKWLKYPGHNLARSWKSSGWIDQGFLVPIQPLSDETFQGTSDSKRFIPFEIEINLLTKNAPEIRRFDFFF
ncbi:MAG TPA: hypothetical protein PLV64_23800 [Anaerolineales bacterium]|nr:hypothetical protein [Anaerolineales bacterium]